MNKIAVLESVGRMAVREEPIPVPKDGEMLVRITHAGLCGSDLHYFRHGGLGSFKQPLPMYMGHEPAGIVVDSNGVNGFEAGDRVAIEPGCPCLTSKWSLAGKHNLCEKGTFMGAGDTPGCFAIYACVKAIQVFKIPSNVDSALASLCEPLGVALHTYKLCGSRTLDLIDGSAVIFGGGAIGLCHLIILKSRGVRDVYVVEKVPYRRALAKSLGASEVYAWEDYKKVGKCELVIDCAGTTESFDACVRVAAVNGTLALVGIPEVDSIDYNPHQARTKELCILNVRRSNQCLNTCMRLLSGSPEVKDACSKLITHEMPLDDIQDAFEMASEYRDCVKIIIKPPEVRHIRRVGFLGLSDYGLAYFKHLLSDPSYEVVYATSKSKPRDHSNGLEDELKCLCEERGIPYFGNVNVNKDVDKFASYDADLVVLGGYDAILKKDFLTRAAKHGVMNTHFGVIPLNRGCNPTMWAILKGLPQGFTTYLCNEEIDLPADEDIVDIVELTPELSGDAGEIYAALSTAAALRFPTVLDALRYGVNLPRPPREKCSNYHTKALPNDSYVSWMWDAAFIKRFSDSQRFGNYPVVRTMNEKGDDLWFKVGKVIHGDVDVAPGTVMDVTEGVVTVSCINGLIKCIADAPSEWSGVMRSTARDIPVDFSGLTLPSNARKLPIFRLDFEPTMVREFQEKAADALTSGRPLSDNVYTREFEKKFASLVGAPYAIAVNSGTMALEIAMRALDVRGKVVVTPSNTFFATQVAARNAGGDVVFVDVEREYMQICPKALRTCLESRDKGTVAAVVLVHIGGIISPHYDEIRSLCKTHGVHLVEDAAHAHLSHVNDDNRAGTIGDVGCFSFFPTKVMTTGEGGMITTKSKELYDIARSIKEFGRRVDGAGSSRLIQDRTDGGVNGKMSEITSVLGLLECDRVEKRVAKRTSLVRAYAKLLDPRYYEVVCQKEGRCAYYKCIVHVKAGDREKLRAYAKERDIAFTGEVYFKGVHEMPAYEHAPTNLPNTEWVCANHVCPPLYPEMSEADVERVCGVMNEFQSK